MSSFKFEVWPTEYRSINQYFGANPQNYAQFGLPGHEGVDIMAPTGSKIFCVAPGRVGMVQTNASIHPYGIHVRVDHEDGYQTIYAHLQEIRVNQGDQVQAGALLGLADNTGNSFGSHLHLTLKKRGVKIGNWPQDFIDPTPFLLPLMGWRRPAGPYSEGWVYTAGIVRVDDLAQANSGGVNLRTGPDVNAGLVDLVPGGTIMIIVGSGQGDYTPVRVATAALPNSRPTPSPNPAPPPAPSETTVDGWAFSSYLTGSGNQAVVGQYGINLRARADRNATNIGLVKGGSTVTVLGGISGEYIPVRARRADFMEPTNFAAAPTLGPGAGAAPSTPPAADQIVAWAWTQNLSVNVNQANSGRLGNNLRARPDRTAALVGLWMEGATATIAGQAQGEYTPVRARRQDIRNLASPLPAIQAPAPLPESPATPPSTEPPVHDTTPGWAFTAQITLTGSTALVGPYGINLRDAPRRDAQNIGFVPANATMIIVGAPQGEYTPVRVDDKIIQPPFGAVPVADTTIKPPIINPEPQPLGQTRFGLHACADPDISEAEIAEFALMRPGIIKLLSFHHPDAVAKLAAAHANASWVVRAFLAFGGRNISPAQFLNDTMSDVRRTLGFLRGRDVVIELHNEPNLTDEGLGSTWSDGASFGRWWLEVLDLYRKQLPGMRFIYPGLSPGGSVGNIKQDHIQFIEASRAAVEAADGLGIHLYWSNVYPMERSLDVLDDYIARFRYKPIWVTEASNNKSGTPTEVKARQYLQFWQELQKRPTVQGVTYFVASASNREFAEEVWVGRGIAQIVGRR